MLNEHNTGLKDLSAASESSSQNRIEEKAIDRKSISQLVYLHPLRCDNIAARWASLHASSFFSFFKFLFLGRYTLTVNSNRLG
jgi:hypothetical protein